MTRPLGALRDPPGREKGAPIGHLVGDSGDIPEAWDLTGPWSRIPNQRGESCNGHDFAQVFRTLSKGALDPSAMAIVGLAQQLEDPTRNVLANRGTYTHRVLEALEQWGLVARDRWKDDADPTKRVPQDVLEAGSLATVSGIYRIWEDGPARSVAIRRAISQGHPVSFAMGVGGSYKLYTGGLWVGETEAIDGGHAQAIVAYRPWGAKVANSWGTDWGEDGYSWIAWSWFETGDVYDLQVATLAPGEVV